MLDYFAFKECSLWDAPPSPSAFTPLLFPTGLLSTVSTSKPSGSTAAAGFTPATVKFPTSTVLVQTLPPLLQTSTTSTISTTGILTTSYLLFFSDYLFLALFAITSKSTKIKTCRIFISYLVLLKCFTNQKKNVWAS